MKNTIMLGLTMVLGVASATALADGDPEAGKKKANTCIGCHGAKGISNVPNYPNLAGQKEDYLVAAMKAYKTGGRDNGTMKAMVASLSEQDIKDLAAYYSGLSCK